MGMLILARPTKITLTEVREQGVRPEAFSMPQIRKSRTQLSGKLSRQRIVRMHRLGAGTLRLAAVDETATMPLEWCVTLRVADGPTYAKRGSFQECSRRTNLLAAVGEIFHANLRRFTPLRSCAAPASCGKLGNSPNSSNAAAPDNTRGVSGACTP